MSAMNAFYAQSGGVTAVINATASGVIETARKYPKKIANVYAGRNGIIGALTEDMIDTNKESAATIAALMHTPGGAFGSARYKLKGIDENRAEYERLIQVFNANDIVYFFYNDGNDSKPHGHQQQRAACHSRDRQVDLAARSAAEVVQQHRQPRHQDDRRNEGEAIGPPPPTARLRRRIPGKRGRHLATMLANGNRRSDRSRRSSSHLPETT